jgi:hypothetical protein
MEDARRLRLDLGLRRFVIEVQSPSGVAIVTFSPSSPRFPGEPS